MVADLRSGPEERAHAADGDRDGRDQGPSGHAPGRCLAAAIEIGGTQNPAAFDAYLRGKHLDRMSFSKENVLARMAAFAGAVRFLDPKFAKAYVGAADAQIGYAGRLPRPAQRFVPGT